jgi:hypothetical protein
MIGGFRACDELWPMRFHGVVALLLTLVAVLTACSTPPGPEPGSPAPRIPEEAIAYDELKSTNRKFPFSGSCSQFSASAVSRMGFVGAVNLRSFGGPGGCDLIAKKPQLDRLWVEGLPPPNKSEPRYFPTLWNGGSAESYVRRFILDGRYYAVEHINFLGGQPGCYLAVDTGSPTALQFRGIVPEQLARSYGELNWAQTNYQIDRAGTDKFMAENCPIVEQMAIPLLAIIDPNGGSLATS